MLGKLVEEVKAIQKENPVATYAVKVSKKLGKSLAQEYQLIAASTGFLPEETKVARLERICRAEVRVDKDLEDMEYEIVRIS